jgi:hypothetical protein
MHKTSGQRDPATAFPLAARRDDSSDRRQANRAIAVSAAGLAVTVFICHVGYEVTADVIRRLADGVDPAVVTAAESAAGGLPGIIHAQVPDMGSFTWTTRAAPDC